MEYREFNITIISASNLEDVRLFRRMRVYAAVSVGGGQEKYTNTSDKRNNTNPSWNYSMAFTVGEWMVEDYDAMLVVKLYCERTLGDRYIGEVSVPMKDLLDNVGAGGGSSMVRFDVLNGGGRPDGLLRFSYRFGKKFTKDSKWW